MCSTFHYPITSSYSLIFFQTNQIHFYVEIEANIVLTNPEFGIIIISFVMYDFPVQIYSKQKKKKKKRKEETFEYLFIHVISNYQF